MDVIKDWISNSYINEKRLSVNSCLFISGYSGIGKTYTINNIANVLDLYIEHINSFNCSTSEQLTDLLMKAYVSSLIQLLTNNNKKKIIIIDDFDILMTIDNTININLYNFIINNTNKLKHIPIICIINIEQIKKLGDIKKKCKIIEMPKMDNDIIHKIFQNYTEDITFNESLKLINAENYNLSNAIKIITNTNYNNVDDITIINDLYGNCFNRNKFKNIIIKEQWIIPLNFHENLINELINNRKGIKKQKEVFYKKFIVNFCYFDIFMTNNIEMCVDFFLSTISELFTFSLKKTKTDTMQNFTKMLSYLSLQKKNKKKSYNNSSFPLNHIGNYHINSINRKFIY